MEIKIILESYKSKKAMIEATEKRIEAYKQMLQDNDVSKYALLSPSIEIGMPKSPGYSRTSQPEAAVLQEGIDHETIMQLINDEKSRIYWVKKEVEQIEAALKALTVWELFVVEAKYFNRLTWRDIEISFNKQFPQKNDITDERLRQISSDAVKKVVEILDPFYAQYILIIKLPENYRKTTRKLPHKAPIKRYNINVDKHSND